MLINRYFTVFRTAARGMEAQRVRMGVATENIANASTSRTADGNPYQIKRAVQTASELRATSFSETLTEMSVGLNRSDLRHMSARGLTGREQSGELGPATEVQQEERIRLEYDPSHPHAGPDGYVRYPDINVVEEMAQMISANRVYEANLSAVQAAKETIKRTLEI